MSKQPTTSHMPDQLSFESAVAELESIVAQMEAGDLPLEQSLQAYTRGAALLKHCQQSLQVVEQQVQILHNQNLSAFEAHHE